VPSAGPCRSHRVPRVTRVTRAAHTLCIYNDAERLAKCFNRAGETIFRNMPLL